jgi:hypothetical protein
MVAAVMGHVSCVAWLLDKGADPYATDGRGYTAAIRALRVCPFVDKISAYSLRTIDQICPW